MRNLRRYWLAFTFVAGAFAISAAAYGSLPAIIPTHWNGQGVIDGWMPKSRGAFFGPCAASVMTVLLILIEPRALREPATGVKPYLYPIIVAAVCGFILYGNASVLMAGMGWHRDILSHSAIGVGLLVIVLGAVMGNVPQNGVIGIRTPWTLASEEVWARTHRIGRWLFVLAGVAAAVAGLLGLRMLPGIVAIGAAAIVSVGYSYFAWRRLRGGSG